MVDGGGLENRCTRKGIGGSNPSPSASLQPAARFGYYVGPSFSWRPIPAKIAGRMPKLKLGPTYKARVPPLEFQYFDS